MFLIILVDVLGFTLVIPLLALYAERFGASPFVATTIVSCYAASSLISTPIIGRLSDQYGRRRLLLLSQAGTCAGFILLGFSTTLWMVFAGRIIDGLTAGNLPVAQAYVSDHTPPEDRAKSFGKIGIAFGIGFAVGPTLGGWLNEYGSQVPFLAAAGLSALSIFCTYTLLPRDAPAHVRNAPSEPDGKRRAVFDIKTYAEYFRRPVLRLLYLQFFLFSFAFALFTTGFALFAERRFLYDGRPWSGREVGFLFGFFGVLGIIWQGGLIGTLVKKYGEPRLIIAGFLSAGSSYVVYGLVPSDSLWLIGIVVVVTSFGHGVLRPVITSRISQVVGRHEQGAALGIAGSLTSVAMIFAPPTGGLMLENRWLFVWVMIPATVGYIGLVTALRSGTNAPPAR